MTGTDSFAHDRGAGAGPNVNHLGSGIGLLPVVGECHGIELTNRISALQHTTRVFPSDGGAGFHLGPADAAAGTTALAPLGHEVVDAADAVFITGVPVLNGGVLDRGVIQDHQLHHRSMQLIGVEHRSRAALEVTHRSSFFGDDQRALELSLCRRN